MSNVFIEYKDIKIRILMKKIIKLTESDLNRIVFKVIQEQTEERNHIKAIQKFLNSKYPTFKLVIDGKTGRNSATEKAIMKYQSDIGVYPTDGVWGRITYDKMPQQDKKILKKFVAEEGDFFDKFMHWVGLDK